MTTQSLVFYISILTSILIGYFDSQTGEHISMMLLYAVPILLAAWYCGKWQGIVVAAVASFSWLIVNVIQRLPGESDAFVTWNAFNRFAIFALLAYTVAVQAKLRLALERERLRADTDRLTGLLNKGAFRERVEEEMNRARRYNHQFTLAFIDLDNFKLINDIQGHARGDKLLQLVSETISQAIRKTDIAGRVGGDEFTICFPEAGEEQARHAINKLVKALDIMTSQSGWQITASIGVLSCIKVCDTYDALLGKADRLMYVAKDRGKNNAVFETLDLTSS